MKNACFSKTDFIHLMWLSPVISLSFANDKTLFIFMIQKNLPFQHITFFPLPLLLDNEIGYIIYIFWIVLQSIFLYEYPCNRLTCEYSVIVYLTEAQTTQSINGQMRWTATSQTVTKLMKIKWLTSSAIKEMQIKIALRFCLTLVWMVVIRNINRKCE